MSPTIDPSKLKVTELREELQARGLDTKGNKPVLVKRLKKALESELNKELPDTSIADTSTEDLDSSKAEDLDSSKAEDLDSSKAENLDGSKFEESKEVDTQSDAVNSSTSRETESEADSNDEPKEAAASSSGCEAVKETSHESNKDEDSSKVETQIDGQEEEIDENKDDCNHEDAEMNDTSGEAQNVKRGEKRKGSDDTIEPAQKRSAVEIKEEEFVIDPNKVLLSWFDSDLHLQINKETFLSAKPLHEGLFGYAWAGVRTTHGIGKGKVRFEVKIIEEMKWEDFTYQRKERQDKAKERKEKEKQQTLQKKKEDTKADKTEDAKDDKSEDAKHDKTEGNKSNDQNATEVEMEVQEGETEKMEVGESEKVVKMEGEPETEQKTDDLKKKEEGDTDESKSAEAKQITDDQEKIKGEVDDDKSEPVDRECGNDLDETTKSEAEISEIQAPILTHIFRTGWSLPKTSLQLGECSYSYGYESTGKFVSNKEFKEFAAPYKLGDVVGAYLNITDEAAEMRYTVNGELQSAVMSIPRSELPEENLILFPHVLTRNLGFELNLGDKEEPWFPSPQELSDYPFIQTLENKVQGPTRPEKREECEVIMMIGLPASGKSHWVEEYVKSNTDKQITVIGNSHLLDKMTVHGQPLKLNYNGRWVLFVDKLQRCLKRLADIAPQHRGNYIIDETNVFPSAQRRKLRAFEGFKRRAVVVVVGDEEQAKRQSLKEAQDGKDVTEYTILEMKANMALPTVGDLVDEIIFTDLNEQEAKAQVAKYNVEGKTGLRKPGFRGETGRWNYNRADYNRGDGNFRDRGPQRFGRGWGQPPPPGRFQRGRRPLPVVGGRDWARHNRGGPPRPVGDRNGRDNRPPATYNRPNQFNRGGARSANWQSGASNYNQGNWGAHQGNWGSGASQGWGGSGYQQQQPQQQQGNWNANQWKYGSGSQHQGGYGGASQQGYGQNWSNYYNQYSPNWTGQGQQGTSGYNQYNQYAQWAQYAQQYAQGQNAKYANNGAPAIKK